jgi:large subunit ribosomal protein L2
MRKKMQQFKSKKLLTKKKPEKGLLLTLKKRAGRSRSGTITVRHKGGGAKRRYRIVDFGQEKINQKGKVIAIEYDPYRTAFLALIEYENGEKGYILAPSNIKIGDEIICSESAELKNGNRLWLKNIVIGTPVYNIELVKGRGGKIVRSAGTSAKVLAHEGNYTHLQMPSGEIRKVPKDCFASIGQVSHPEKRFEKIRKAGIKRLKGKRPTVRGTAMNPPDHPHGGGSGGKAPIGLKHPKTPWGKHALGVRTRRKKRWTKKLILKRRKKKR